MISSRDIDALLPPVARRCREFIRKCAVYGIDVLITGTYRDHEAQAKLYAQGRTAPGRIVTRAKPGQSFHNWRVAFDFVPLINGKPRWNDEAAFKTCGEIAETCGLEWSGRWKKFRELAHCQYTGGLSIKDFQQGATLPEDNDDGR